MGSIVWWMSQSCKWDVRYRDRDSTEMLESRDQDEARTFNWSDETETFKKCLETILRPRRSRPRLQPWNELTIHESFCSQLSHWWTGLVDLRRTVVHVGMHLTRWFDCCWSIAIVKCQIYRAVNERLFDVDTLSRSAAAWWMTLKCSVSAVMSCDRWVTAKKRVWAEPTSDRCVCVCWWRLCLWFCLSVCLSSKKFMSGSCSVLYSNCLCTCKDHCKM